MPKNVYKTTALVTVLSSLERTLGFLYRVILSRYIGAEGVGLYQVALSLFAVFLTVGTGGIPVTVSRLKTKAYAENRTADGDGALSAGAVLSLLCTLPVCVFFFVFGKKTSVFFSDERCVPLFTLLLIALPLTCIYADVRGSFWGDKKFLLSSAIELFEESVMVIVGVALLKDDVFSDAADGAKLAVIAVVISYFCSFFASIAAFFIGGGKIWSPKKQLKPLFLSAAPITAVRTFSTLTSSAVAVVLPAMLIKSGLTQSQALQTFGVAAGMALPVLSVPSTFIGCVSLVMTPELSENFYKKRVKKLTADVEKGVFIAVAFSCLFSPFFTVFGTATGQLLYSNVAAGEMISRCAFMLLPMSVSLITTSVLNSMNYEKQTLRFYFIGAAAMLICVFFLPSKIGAYAYPVGLTASFFCTAACNLYFLTKKFVFSPRLTKKSIAVFLLTVPVTLFAKAAFGVMKKAFSTPIAIIVAAMPTLLFNATLWGIFGVLRPRKGKKAKKADV